MARLYNKNYLMLSKMPEIIAKIFIMALKYIIYQQAFGGQELMAAPQVHLVHWTFVKYAPKGRQVSQRYAAIDISSVNSYRLLKIGNVKFEK